MEALPKALEGVPAKTDADRGRGFWPRVVIPELLLNATATRAQGFEPLASNNAGVTIFGIGYPCSDKAGSKR